MCSVSNSLQVKRPYRELADYVIALSGLKKSDVAFVRLDGSAAEGKDRGHSDYDVVIVAGTGRGQGRASHWGVFNGRLVSYWIMSLEEYSGAFGSVDAGSFAWQRASARKALAIFGDEDSFRRLNSRIGKQSWTADIQSGLIMFHYGNVAEYFGKMLNTGTSRREAHVFYLNAVQLGDHYAQLVAAFNRTDLDSDRTMHDQVFRCSHRPPNLRGDLLLVTGYRDGTRSRALTLMAAARLVRWARTYIVDSYGLEKFTDRGFRDVVLELDW